MHCKLNAVLLQTIEMIIIGDWCWYTERLVLPVLSFPKWLSFTLLFRSMSTHKSYGLLKIHSIIKLKWVRILSHKLYTVDFRLCMCVGANASMYGFCLFVLSCMSLMDAFNTNKRQFENSLCLSGPAAFGIKSSTFQLNKFLGYFPFLFDSISFYGKGYWRKAWSHDVWALTKENNHRLWRFLTERKTRTICLYTKNRFLALIQIEDAPVYLFSSVTDDLTHSPSPHLCYILCTLVANEFESVTNSSFPVVCSVS